MLLSQLNWTLFGTWERQVARQKAKHFSDAFFFVYFHFFLFSSFFVYFSYFLIKRILFVRLIPQGRHFVIEFKKTNSSRRLHDSLGKT